MTITRYRNGSGTTVTMDETRDPVRVRLPSRAPVGPDDEDADRICDRGSVIPSARWAGNARSELPDADALPDVSDMLTDFDIEDYCKNFYQKRHYGATARKRPYLTVEVLHGSYGEEMPLTVPYDFAARDERRMFKILYDEQYRAVPMKPETFKAWKETNLTWRDDDDLKPLKELIFVDPILDECRYVSCGKPVFKTGWIFDHHKQAHIPIRVDQTPYKVVRDTPQWFRDLMGDSPKDGQSVED